MFASIRRSPSQTKSIVCVTATRFETLWWEDTVLPPAARVRGPPSLFLSNSSVGTSVYPITDVEIRASDKLKALIALVGALGIGLNVSLRPLLFLEIGAASANH